MDQLSHQEIFRPGGAVKIINRKGVYYGFLLRWTTGPEFDILDTVNNVVRTFDYLKCKEVWYRPVVSKMGKYVIKLVKDLQSGKKEFQPLKEDHRELLLEFIRGQ